MREVVFAVFSTLAKNELSAWNFYRKLGSWLIYLNAHTTLKQGFVDRMRPILIVIIGIATEIMVAIMRNIQCDCGTFVHN